jgi:hypothetical protein
MLGVFSDSAPVGYGSPRRACAQSLSAMDIGAVGVGALDRTFNVEDRATISDPDQDKASVVIVAEREAQYLLSRATQVVVACCGDESKVSDSMVGQPPQLDNDERSAH